MLITSVVPVEAHKRYQGEFVQRLFYYFYPVQWFFLYISIFISQSIVHPSYCLLYLYLFISIYFEFYFFLTVYSDCYLFYFRGFIGFYHFTGWSLFNFIFFARWLFIIVRVDIFFVIRFVATVFAVDTPLRQFAATHRRPVLVIFCGLRFYFSFYSLVLPSSLTPSGTCTSHVPIKAFSRS